MNKEGKRKKRCTTSENQEFCIRVLSIAPATCLILTTLILLCGISPTSGATTVPASGRYIEEAFQNVQVTPNVTYGSATDYLGNNQTLLLDVYEPAGDVPNLNRPAIVWIHGGTFCRGDKRDSKIVALATAFAKRGYVSVSINYRLRDRAAVDETAATDAMQDARQAVAWLRNNSSLYHIDPTLIAIAGTSAGAITSLRVAYPPSASPNEHVSAAVDLWGKWVHPTDPFWQNLSATMPPLLIIHGDADTTMPYCLATVLEKGAQYAGLPYEFHKVVGMDHEPAGLQDTFIGWITPFLYTHMNLSSLPAVPVPSPPVSAVQLPKTGQKTYYSYHLNHKAKDDGAAYAGVAWPNPRFTITYRDSTGNCSVQTSDCDTDSSNDVVTDNLTGLIWTRDAGTPGTVACAGGIGCSAGSCSGSVRTWQQALDYVACLSANNYLQHNDWRLPNIIELKSIVNVGQSITLGWLTAHGFANLQSANYWSSTSGAVSPSNYAWALKFDDEIVDYDSKSNNYFVWPVRQGPNGVADPTYPANIWKTDSTSASWGVTWPLLRFTDNGTTVTDNLTGLIWAKDAGTPNFSSCTGGAMHWQGPDIPLPLEYVECLNANNYLNYYDWRLPNINELQSLVDYSQYSPALPTGHPSSATVQSKHYWSSTAHSDSAGDAWSVDFYGGGVYYGDRPTGSFVWPVRGGVITVNTVPHLAGLSKSHPFNPRTDVAFSTTLTSNSAPVSHINAPATISISGGDCSINNNGVWVTSGTVDNGDTIIVRQTSAGPYSYSTTTDAILTIGGIEEKFSVTTLADTSDTTPEPFAFDNYSLTDVTPSPPLNPLWFTSNSITVTGIGALLLF